MSKTVENLAEWLQPRVNEGTLDDHAPILADTG